MEIMTTMGGPCWLKNGFAKFHAAQPDAITLKLVAQDRGQFGVVHCPANVSGGRMIDTIVINSILTALSRGILDRQLPKGGKTNAVVSVANAEFA